MYNEMFTFCMESLPTTTKFEIFITLSMKRAKPGAYCKDKDYEFV